MKQLKENCKGLYLAQARQPIRVLALALTWFIAVNVQAAIIADARGDFVAGISDGDPGTLLPATGTGTWNYLASDTANPTTDGDGLDVLTWDDSANQSYNYLTGGGSADSVDIQNINLAPDEIRMHPSTNAPSFAVVRWIAGPGEAGSINITGNVRKIDAGGGNGVTFGLFADGISLFSSTIAYNDTTGVSFDETVTVSVGSTVDFVIGSIANDSYDSIGLEATITPEPATICLLALGGLMLRRRKSA